MEQIFRIAQQMALMIRIIVEDVDALPDQVLRRDRQEMLQGGQSRLPGLIGVDDLEIVARIAHQHIHRHGVDHGLQFLNARFQAGAQRTALFRAICGGGSFFRRCIASLVLCCRAFRHFFLSSMLGAGFSAALIAPLVDVQPRTERVNSVKIQV